MHQAVGDQRFLASTLSHLHDQLQANTPDVRSAIGQTYGTNEAEAIEAHRQDLVSHFSAAAQQAAAEPSHLDEHYVSRVDVVGAYQAVLARVFQQIPDLQGLGNKNISWLSTLLEQGAYNVGTFFQKTWEDVHGDHKPLLPSILAELKQLPHERAAFPGGTPTTVELKDDCRVALLADWGGDNPAARNVAKMVAGQNPDVAIHLGDIYYGGIQAECEQFLRLWPLQTDAAHPGAGIPKGSSYALNGNHEMYTGGAAFFSTVLPAFGQEQSFFCLQTSHWRLIGLDSAYCGGRLSTTAEDSSLQAQWDWLVDLLKNGPPRANILMTHHQPVSAHAQEHGEAQQLRADATRLLAMEGIGPDAIHGWFFGHEHRCMVYDDSALPFRARLIGNGCIPHEAQQERIADPGCDAIAYVNRREEMPGSSAAVSSFASLYFYGDTLTIDYIDEDGTTWGTEAWNSTNPAAGTPFRVYDNRSF